ncbi:hypothetical protein HIM_06249 [Hirsutella minnesotensis 3608]|uniref:Plastocyanin-like domain-containing protein n=1 Tax=Hirsutella minnesotensis 3608 TaxID=1043627 RepID=A0A0F8A4Z5_9HYPO|nr:hypothetical protein HIM_06249 [Hirsutella minnesotensis 3608]
MHTPADKGPHTSPTVRIRCFPHRNSRSTAISLDFYAQFNRRVVFHMQHIEGYYNYWTVSNNSWTEDADVPIPHTTPDMPYLVALYQNQTAYLPDYEEARANGGYDKRTGTYPARMGEVIEIVLQQHGAHIDPAIKGEFDGIPGMLATHPWHLHGAPFWDAGGGDGAWTPEKAEAQLAGTQPVRRDTTTVYRYREFTEQGAPSGWRVWRVRVTQPGVWMMHCHTLPHMVQGMQAVWVHGDADEVMRLGKPELQGYLEFGGDAYGNKTHAPRAIHFSELSS